MGEKKTLSSGGGGGFTMQQSFLGTFSLIKPKQDRGSRGFTTGGAVDEKCRTAVPIP